MRKMWASKDGWFCMECFESKKLRVWHSSLIEHPTFQKWTSNPTNKKVERWMPKKIEVKMCHDQRTLDANFSIFKRSQIQWHLDAYFSTWTHCIFQILFLKKMQVSNLFESFFEKKILHGYQKSQKYFEKYHENFTKSHSCTLSDSKEKVNSSDTKINVDTSATEDAFFCRKMFMCVWHSDLAPFLP